MYIEVATASPPRIRPVTPRSKHQQCPTKPHRRGSSAISSRGDDASHQQKAGECRRAGESRDGGGSGRPHSGEDADAADFVLRETPGPASRTLRLTLALLARTSPPPSSRPSGDGLPFRMTTSTINDVDNGRHGRTGRTRQTRRTRRTR